MPTVYKTQISRDKNRPASGIRALMPWVFTLAVSMGFSFLVWSALNLKPQGEDGHYAIALEWNEFILYAETHTEGFRGPVAARTYAYVNLAAYEAALSGLPEGYLSVSPRYSCLLMPTPPEAGSIDHGVSLNACYAAILEQFFLSAPQNVEKERKKLASKWEEKLSKGLDAGLISRSKEHGKTIATTIFQWSSTDSLGHQGNLHNYDRSYSPPKGEGKWRPSPDFPMPPMLPYWGEVRPFLIRTEDFLARPLPEYDSEPHSTYYDQALELLSLSSPLSAENQWIAEFWNDDYPGLTFTPSGHWLSIANQVVAREKPTLEKTLETYLKLSFAMSDAIVACWRSKYHYSLQRPELFIRENLSGEWRPHAPSPSFPAYPSGHATMGAAAAQVLAHLYGDNYELTDRSPGNRQEFRVKPRRFHSFSQMARENSLSRMYLGVHFRMDCEEGMRLGTEIGREAANMEIIQ
jgi:hypothetical protein